MGEYEERNGDINLSSRRFSDVGNQKVWTVGGGRRAEKVYSYDEALELAGHGRYNIGLLLTLSLAIHAMAMDLFGFSAVVSGATCDLKLDHGQKSLLLIMPLLGPTIMAYPWGYLADTQGRKRSLVIALWGSFVAAILSAFSFNWIVLAVLKFICSAFSGGIQSIACTLMGESCVQRHRNSYLLILTSFLMSAFFIYTLYGYFALRTPFSVNIGLITFTPWRLLTLILSLSLGATLFCLSSYHESPKFLLNVGLHDEALDVLKKIHKKNGRCNDVYPVNKITINEASSFKKEELSFLRSLREQTVPLFKPPLLYRSLQLYYLTFVIYSSNNGFYGWLPFFMDAFSTSLSSTSSFNDTYAICGMIVSSKSFQDSIDMTTCTSPVELLTVWTSLIHGVTFTVCSLLMVFVANRKKMLLITLFLVSGASSIISVSMTERISSIVFFYGVMLNCLCIGVVFAYFVDLFPTSYRGMASCLGIMVARGSAAGSVHIIGAYIVSHCNLSFYVLSILILSGIFVSIFLPPDCPKKE